MMTPAPEGYLKECTGRTCKAQIFFAITQKGKKIPLDVAPNPEGSFVVEENHPDTPLAIWHTKAPREGMERFMQHHATCPDVESFR